MNSTVIESILSGVLVTVQVTLLAIALAAPVSFGVAIASRSSIRIVRGLALAYVEFLRGTSALVQLFWAFFVLPAFGFTAPPEIVGFVVLGLNASAYGAEIVRGGLASVPRAQLDGTKVLQLPRSTTLVRVLIPQALPVMLPALGNLAIDVLKASSLVSLITVTDFTKAVTQWALTGVLDITLAFSILLAGYLLLSLPITGTFHWLERRARRFLNAGRQS